MNDKSADTVATSTPALIKIEAYLLLSDGILWSRNIRRLSEVV